MPKEKTIDPVHSCIRGENRHLIARVAKLYFQPGWKIADITWGKGRFWRNIDTSQFDLWGSDDRHPERTYDFRSLPYADGEFNAVVFDPPYIVNDWSAKRLLEVKENKSYGWWLGWMYDVDHLRSYDDILGLFLGGIKEASRIVKDGGVVLVKCQDQCYRGKQKWTHVEVFEMAAECGLAAVDLFILHRITPPTAYGKQRIARKNHSYLWVFQK